MPLGSAALHLSMQGNTIRASAMVQLGLALVCNVKSLNKSDSSGWDQCLQAPNTFESLINYNDASVMQRGSPLLSTCWHMPATWRHT